jgi:hypothetical protein
VPDDPIDAVLPSMDASDEFRERARAELSAMWRGQPTLAAETPDRSGGDRHGWFVLGAAAAIVVVVLAGVTFVRETDDRSDVASVPPTAATATNSPTTPTQPTTPTTTAAVTSTVPSAVSSSIEEPTTTVPAPGPDEPISVGFADPPPVVEPLRAATLEIGSDAAFIGLGAGIAVVGVPEYRSTDGIARLVVVDLADGSVEELAVDRVPSGLVVGPGPVVYGEILDETVATYVAIALTGERAGDTVWSAPSPGHAAEPFDNILAHGPDGIVDRWNGDALVTRYRDERGDEASIGEPTHIVPLTEVEDGAVVRSSNGVSWELGIERDPTAPASLPNAVTAGPSGSAVAATWIGPRIGDDADYGTPTVPVVAVLRADGSGSWYRLPDGWSVVDSNRWGTLVARSSETTFELGLLDPALFGQA